MAIHRIRAITQNDLEMIAHNSAVFSATDPLITIKLPQNHLYPIPEDRREHLASATYTVELMKPFNPWVATRPVLAYNISTPHLIEASACIQYYRPDPCWHAPWAESSSPYDWKNVSGRKLFDGYLYFFFWNNLHRDRKISMRGKGHYCASLKPFIPIKG